jgi:glycerophosphoryl diester phosphodiesterase
VDELLAIGRPIVLAHTAGEDEFPASTLFAFGESVAAGVDMLDLNINLTADDELLVQHDDTFDRNTNGTGPVVSLTAAEAAELDAAYWFTTDCSACRDRPDDEYLYRGIRTGERPPPPGYAADDFALPTLRQLVERFPDLPLNIEIKGEGDIARRTADVLAAQLVELGRADASVVASFDDEVVAYFHSIAPDVEVSPGLGVLTAYVLDGTPPPDGMRILQLPPVYSGLEVITPELVARATADGFPIWVWPNDRALENLASYRDFLAQGIQGLNINFPAQGVQAVQDFLVAAQ